MENCPSICRFYEGIEDRHDLWLVFEAVDGRPIFTSMNELKGSFVMGERLYDVIQMPELRTKLEADDCRGFR